MNAKTAPGGNFGVSASDSGKVFLKGEDGKTGRFEDGSEQIIGACIEVHRHLGPGLVEKVYEQALCHELTLRGLSFERQRRIPVEYKGVNLGCGLRADLIVEDRILLELKTVEHLSQLHKVQTLTYLKMCGLGTALLVNFNVVILRLGLHRLTRDDLASSEP